MVTWGTPLPHDHILMIDLLAPLHTSETVLRIAGMHENAPTTVGKTCVRILGFIEFGWTTDGINPLQIDDGAWVGILKNPWTFASEAHEYTPSAAAEYVDPYDPEEAANTSDWAYWSHHSPFDEVYTSDEGDNLRIGHWPIDVRAKRHLKELGDSMILCIRPDGDGNQNITNFRLVTSSLIR